MSDWRRLDPRALAIRPVEDLVRAAVPLLLIFFSGRGDGPRQWLTLAGAMLYGCRMALAWTTLVPIIMGLGYLSL